MMLIDIINMLDDQLFNGVQKYERLATLYINHLLCSLGLTIDNKYVSRRLPIIVRSFEISLKDDYIKQIFSILSSSGQSSTDIDILFIGCSSPFGHESKANYYVEVEMHQRDHLAVQRLLDFSEFCKSKNVDLFPILVTNQRPNGYYRDICVVNFNNLKLVAGTCGRYLTRSEQIPGLAWDYASICFYILDLLSRQERTVKNDLLHQLVNTPSLWQKKPNFKRFLLENVSLKDCLQKESEKEFRRRMNQYFLKLKKARLICDTPDGWAYQITHLGSKYIIDWRSEFV